MIVTITLNEKQSVRNMGEALQRKYGPILIKRSEKARENIIELLRTNFIDSDTYRSLTDIDGILRAEFGLTFSDSSKIEDMINSFDLVHMGKTATKFNSVIGFNFQFKLGISYTDYSDIDVSSGSFATEKGDVIPWLYWLLFAGVETVVSDYSVKFLQGGRSGYAVMIKRKNGGSYTVDPKYAGTISSNWITDVVLRSALQIKEELTKVLYDNL